MVESLPPPQPPGWSQRPHEGGRRRQWLRETASRLLTDYLDAVAAALRAEGLTVVETSLEPGPDLQARLTVRPPDPDHGVPGLIELAWAEDTGWCLSHHLLGTPATPWRYLHIELAPTPATVARFVTVTLSDADDVGMLYPAQFRFRGQPIQPVIDALTDALARHARAAHHEPPPDAAAVGEGSADR